MNLSTIGKVASRQTQGSPFVGTKISWCSVGSKSTLWSHSVDFLPSSRRQQYCNETINHNPATDTTTSARTTSIVKSADFLPKLLKLTLPQTKDHPQLAFYNRNLSYFVTQGQYDKAELWFFKMKTEGVAPSLATYTLMLWMYSKEATNIVALTNLMNELRESNLELSRTPYAITLNAYAENKMIREIEELVQDMDSRKISKDLVLYNILIEAYGRASMGDKSIDLYYKMKDEGVRPSEITFNLLFDVCGWNSRIEKANELWKEMTDVYPVTAVIDLVLLFTVIISHLAQIRTHP